MVTDMKKAIYIIILLGTMAYVYLCLKGMATEAILAMLPLIVMSNIVEKEDS